MPTNPLDFTTPTRDLHQVTVFKLDGEALEAVEPKSARFLSLVRSIDTSDEFQQAGLIEDFLDLCMTEATAARLRERLDDDEDPFDLDTLTQIIRGLQEAWTRRPTGPSATSSGRPKRTGTASTVRRRQSA